MAGNGNQIENRLWAAADELRANSKLKSSEYAVPVLGLIFLRYADQKFSVAQKEIEGQDAGRRNIRPVPRRAKGWGSKVLMRQIDLGSRWATKKSKMDIISAH